MEPRNPTFSVVIPAYNAADTIQSAVGSVLAQTHGDLEVVVVDDGSDDGTGEIVRGLKDERVKLVAQPNGGTAVALNTAIAHSRGAFISILGADDLFLPTYLEVMERTLAAAPHAGFAYCDAWIFDRRRRRVSRITANAPQEPPVPPPADSATFLRELLKRNFVFGLATVRRPALDAVGPFRPHLRNRQDHEMWLRLVANGFLGVPAPGLLAVYRRVLGGKRISVSARMVDSTIAEREVYRIVAEEYDLPDTLRDFAYRRMREAEQQIERVRISHARRRLIPTRFRRFAGRMYRRVQQRDMWYPVAPPELRAAFPNLSEF